MKFTEQLVEHFVDIKDQVSSFPPSQVPGADGLSPEHGMILFVETRRKAAGVGGGCFGSRLESIPRCHAVSLLSLICSHLFDKANLNQLIRCEIQCLYLTSRVVPQPEEGSDSNLA